MFGNGAVIVIRPDDGEVGERRIFAVRQSIAATHSIHVRVDDADRHHEQTARFGAGILHPPTEYPYGERQYSAEDPSGHRRTFSQSIAEIEPASWGGVWMITG